MTPLQAWKTILDKLGEDRMDFPTVPKTNKTPVWFSAKAVGEFVYIDSARHHRPSSKISVPRKLHYKTFEKIYPIYLRRENGEQVSSEAAAVTVNQVYYY